MTLNILSFLSIEYSSIIFFNKSKTKELSFDNSLFLLCFVKLYLSAIFRISKSSVETITLAKLFADANLNVYSINGIPNNFFLFLFFNLFDPFLAGIIATFIKFVSNHQIYFELNRLIFFSSIYQN